MWLPQEGSYTHTYTNRILDVLEKERPKIILIDELDKMSKPFQNQLLNFMESGKIDVEQQRKQYDFEIKGVKVFVTYEGSKLIGYQNHFRVDLESYSYPDIQKNSYVSEKVLSNPCIDQSQYC